MLQVLSTERYKRYINILLLLLLTYTVKITVSSILDTAEVADLVQEFQWNLLELNLETTGLCESRPLPFSEDQRARDVAYDLSSTDEVINTTAGSLFPSGIPEEFVVFATVKVQPDNTADLFTISDGDQSLSFSLNPIEFEYRRRGVAPVRAGVQESIADGAWHRVAFAVRRKHLALSLDCAKPKTRVRRPRGFKPSFSQNSNVRIGGQFKVRAKRPRDCGCLSFGFSRNWQFA